MNVKKISFLDPIAALIIIQALIFFFGSFITALSKEDINLVQFIIDVVFLGDVLKRMKNSGREFFNSKWNLIDLSLIIGSLILFWIPNSQINTLTLLKVFRLFKLLGINARIPNIDNVTKKVISAGKASRSIFLVLIVLVIFFSILGWILFGNSVPQHFSDPLVSAYTVFSLFTLEGWNEIPAAVTTTSFDYYLIRGFVISVILFGSFFALSLASAIFIDEMVLDNNEELEKKFEGLKLQIKSQSKQIEKLISLHENSK